MPWLLTRGERRRRNRLPGRRPNFDFLEIGMVADIVPRNRWPACVGIRTGLRQRIKGWEERAASLRDEVAQRTALSLIVGRLQDFARQVRDRMSAVDWSLQRDLIRLLVKRVEIDRGDINVVFRVAPSFDPGYGGSQDDRSLHRRGWSDHTSLGGPLRWTVHAALLQNAAFQPFVRVVG